MALSASFPVHAFEEKQSSKVHSFHLHTPGAILSLASLLAELCVQQLGRQGKGGALLPPSALPQLEAC